MARVDALSAFARSRGHSILELAMSWLLHRDVVASVIAGATNPEQVRTNVGATSWQLTEADIAEIDRLVPLR
jgi:aryl-alcohol dehydrogenase-like predicted oxidoreductase